MPKCLDFGYKILDVKFNKRSGFTIIELLVVISLMAIISGIGFASLVSYSRSQIVNQTAEDLKQVINEAKFDAVSSVKPTLCTSSDLLDSYTVFICSNGANSAVCATEGINNNKGYFISAKCGVTTKTVESKTVPSNVSVISTCQTLKFNAVTATFSGTTSSVGFPCSIIISGYGVNNTINVGPLGNYTN